MIIGVPKEIKTEEYRVGASPIAVETLTQAGHQVLVQATAGKGSGFSDEEYVKAGATIVSTAEEVWKQAEMIYHIKEPIAPEYPLLQRDQILFSFLHLAAEKELTFALMDKGVTAIAFETVEAADGSTPLLDPMSAIAGQLATQIAAQYLRRTSKGGGRLLGGTTGVPPATVVIIGGGIVGTNAAKVALGLGARVTIRSRYVFHLDSQSLLVFFLIAHCCSFLRQLSQ